jgi:CheY-like chemotaxis protein
VNFRPQALIVEDLDFWQEMLGEILIDTGYRVCSASSYSEALEALARCEFQLAVIDPVLDDTNRRNRDGLRVLRHILSQKPNIRTLIITASDANRIRREVSEMSPDIPLLWKDEWDDNRFLAVVQELLNEAHDA